MFDISIWELLVVVVIGLLVLGPQQIPQIAFRVGRWVRYAKNAWYALSSELRAQMQDDMTKTDNKDEKPTCNNKD